MTSRMLSVPRLTKISMIPSANPTSPTRLTMNAFFAASAADRFVLPEADQQVARQPDQLPGDEDDEEVVGEDEEQHREHEQVQVGEEPPVARVVAHVADRVDVDEQPDRRHDDQQAGGQGVDEEAGLDVEARRPGSRCRGGPVAVARRLLVERRAVGQRRERDDHARSPRRRRRPPTGIEVGLLVEPPADDGRDRRSRPAAGSRSAG